MKVNPRILMVAAENGTLDGAKIGGVGDVLRDLPMALNNNGAATDCIIPSYGFLARRQDIDLCHNVSVPFAGETHTVQIYRIARDQTGTENINTIYIVHHALFSAQGETVYCDDGADKPFASDATKFAFFCSCVAQAMLTGTIPKPDIIHCHDWHSAFLLILIHFSKRLRALQAIPTVYTIHNLAMQGVRPFSGDVSSLEQWYPGLEYDKDIICDPIHQHCLNPMRAAICIAERVHAVSPTYAQEILIPSNHDAGIYGGENLEYDLRNIDRDNRLIGILNGCYYPERSYKKSSWTSLQTLCRSAIESWASRDIYLKSAHWLAYKKLDKLQKQKKKPGMIITSVGRLTAQKMTLLKMRMRSGETCLEKLLDTLAQRGLVIILGSGDPSYEHFFNEMSTRHDNLLFLNGYSESLSDTLFASGDLFIMPSSFEPCGISQLLAMRSGQLCLVNQVGGLKDTVTANNAGFSFSGYSPLDATEKLHHQFSQALDLFEQDQAKWQAMIKQAQSLRFTWDATAQSYLKQLYNFF